MNKHVSLIATSVAILAVGVGTASAATIKVPTAFTKFKYKGGSDPVFKGAIDSTNSECIDGRKVKLFRKANGKTKTLGSDNTDASGKFKMGLGGQAKNGKYYAEVKQSSFSNGVDKTVCLDRQSPKVKIGS
jgi:hypothetical protein